MGIFGYIYELLLDYGGWTILSVFRHNPVIFSALLILLAVSITQISLSKWNWLRFSRRKRTVLKPLTKPALASCPVCGSIDCERHRPGLSILEQRPWTDLHIPQRIDLAIEQIANELLERHVYDWYRQDVSNEESFVDELRTAARFLLSKLLRRIQSLDLTVLVTDHILVHGARHLNVYLQALTQVEQYESVQDAFLRLLGPNVHAAVRSRQYELEYLRHITSKLLPILLPPAATNSLGARNLMQEILTRFVLMPAMDAAANPDNLNNLLLIATDESTPVSNDPLSPDVVFLEHFAEPRCSKSSILHRSISDVLDNHSALYPFMQFMKREGAVNVLQFCLQTHEFNKDLIKADLTSDQLQALHIQLKELFDQYCEPQAVDRINFSSADVEQLRKFVEGPTSELPNLRNSHCLFSAYEHAFQLLGSTFLPLFHQSDEYYSFICGDRKSAPAASINRQQSVRKKADSMIRPVSKSKLTIKSRIEEGVLDPGQEAIDYIPQEGEVHQIDQACEVVVGDEEFPQHDLSSWRVSIVDIIPIPQGKLPVDAFLIESCRADSSDACTVARKHSEFYLLEERLREFHGDSFSTLILPPKPSGSKSKSHSYLRSRQKPFQDYLQHLLTLPMLRRSELIHSFLTCRDFSTGHSNQIGNLFKQMPLKMKIERGQHLESFLSSFLTSCELPKPRPGQRRNGPNAEEITRSRLSSSLYGNNASVGFRLMPDACDVTSDDSPNSDLPTVYHVIMFILTKVYKLPDWLRRALLGLDSLLQPLVIKIVQDMIDEKISNVTCEHRLVKIINSLNEALFSGDPPRTDDDKAQRRQASLKSLTRFITNRLGIVLGESRCREGTELVHHLLQYPLLNKQLSYVLLDAVLLNLFPELSGDIQQQQEHQQHQQQK